MLDAWSSPIFREEQCFTRSLCPLQQCAGNNQNNSLEDPAFSLLEIDSQVWFYMIELEESTPELILSLEKSFL